MNNMTSAADVIKIATGQIGYRESGVNHQKYSPAVPGLEWSQNQPWCATFISWLFLKAGGSSIAPRTASCENGVDWYKAKGRFGHSPKVGAQVFYGANGGVHTELVVAVGNGEFTTIGGNTSGSLNGRYYAGDGVYRKSVDNDESRIYGFGYPLYSGDTKPIPNPYPGYLLRLQSPYMHDGNVRQVQNRLNKVIGAGLSVDSIFGPATASAVRTFQKRKGLESDGIVGPKTWAKLFA